MLEEQHLISNVSSTVSFRPKSYFYSLLSISHANFILNSFLSGDSLLKMFFSSSSSICLRNLPVVPNCIIWSSTICAMSGLTILTLDRRCLASLVKNILRYASFNRACCSAACCFSVCPFLTFCSSTMATIPPYLLNDQFRDIWVLFCYFF